jgi:hypothetical protein
MGRSFKACTKGTMKLELSALIKAGLIKKDGKRSGEISWSNGCRLSIVTHNTTNERFMQLSYAIMTGSEKKVMDYKINLDSVPSNLGNGEILYFQCPVTGERCRILYMTYGSDIFQSRQAYDTRIYYNLQSSAKRWRPNTKYWNLDSRIKELEAMRFTDTYKGQETKRALLLQRLKAEQAEADKLRLIRLAGSPLLRHIQWG